MRAELVDEDDVLQPDFILVSFYMQTLVPGN